MKKRLWAIFLSICLVVTLLSTMALAADGVKTSGNCGPYDYTEGAYSNTVTWSLSTDSTDSSKYVLTISGSGPMGNAFTTVDGVSSGAPEWYELGESIVKVIIEDGVTSVGAKSFKNYISLKEASLPAGITEIGADAFYGSGITSVELPAKLEKMGAQAFYSSSLAGEIVIPNGVAEIPNLTFAKTKISAVSFGSGVKAIGNSAFSECTELKEVVLPDTVTSIGDTAFKSCSKLETVIFPSNTQFTSILKNSFKDCTALKEIQIPDSVVEIGEAAFRGCTTVTKVILPKALTTIAKEAFYGDSSLVAAFIPATVTNIPYGTNTDNQIFKGMADKSVIYLENSDLVKFMLQSSSYPASTTNGYTMSTTALALTNGGTFPAGMTFESGKLATPIKDGCIFDGWYTDEACTQNFTGTPTANSTYYAKWSEIIAAVGSVNYSTLTAAINAAQDGDTVTMLKDVDENVTIPAGKTITLDLNGKNIAVTSGCAIVNKGTLTVTGSGNVTTSAAESAAVANFPGATANLNGGTYSSDNWYVIKNLGTMTIDGPVTVKKPDNSTNTASLIDNGWVGNSDSVAGESVAAEAGKAKLTIKNDAFEGISGPASCAVVKNDDYGVLEITGGNFDSTKNTETSNAATILNWNVAMISGGTFKGSYPISNGSFNNEVDQGKLTISGGNFIGTSSLLGQAQGGTSNKGKLTITDGSFNAPQFGAFDYALEISGGNFSQSVKKEYLDSSLNAELKRASGETPYSYYTDVAAAAAAAQPGDTVTDLSAQSGTFTLTLKYDDGATTADIIYNVANGTSITLPAPTRIGYTFNGWYDGSTKVSSPYEVTKDVTLTASWSYISSGSSSSDPTYSVSTPSKTENGTVTVSPKSASKGDTVTITVKPDSGYVLETLTVTDKNGNELTLKDKGNGKYTFVMPAGKVEVKATFAKEIEVSPFADVATDGYYYEAVKWAVKNGITTGVGNDLFAPGQPCTRAQIVTFLWRAAGAPEPKGTAASLTDVVSGSYYEKAVAWAIENGITTGTGDSKFSPDATCTRAQAVTFLARALNAKAVSAAEFSDVPTDSYFADAVAWAAANGVTEGIGGGLFGSDNDCTRGQIVTFLYRAYNK